VSQPTLDFDAVPVVLPEGSIAARFDRWVRENPELVPRLADAALRLKRQGRKHYGVKKFFEDLRWDDVPTPVRADGSRFKINNSYTAPMARLLMERYPELDGFFETRERRAL
jgi:hypothetical protein